MKVDVFLDSNILFNDYEIINHRLSDLVEWFEKEKIEYSLCIAEMTYHELLKKFDNNVKSMIAEFKKVNKDHKALRRLHYNIEELKEHHVSLKEEYENRLREKFEIITPSADANKNVFERYYDDLSPFKNEKKEFQDALIWETIFEHSQCLENQDAIWFVSSDKKAFYNSIENGLDSDFEHDGNIFFYRNLNDLLEEKDVLIDDLLFENIEEITEDFQNDMNNKVRDFYIIEENILDFLEDYILNNNFISEYADEGWGTDLYVYNIELSELHYADGYRSTSHIYLPATMSVEFEFNIETRNPVYEKGDTDFEQNIIIGEESRNADIDCILVYDLKNRHVVDVEQIEFQ
ncbi:PIN domain-containing protein [Salinicoccus sp. HZC-1]|uniref:PIN domain-containing protein n=1 Tax=Salinicoccus sp. HZC-1 TaxID=3385497 RepID=UPI00398ACB46